MFYCAAVCAPVLAATRTAQVSTLTLQVQYVVSFHQLCTFLLLSTRDLKKGFPSLSVFSQSHSELKQALSACYFSHAVTFFHMLRHSFTCCDTLFTCCGTLSHAATLFHMLRHSFTRTSCSPSTHLFLSALKFAYSQFVSFVAAFFILQVLLCFQS